MVAYQRSTQSDRSRSLWRLLLVCLVTLLIAFSGYAAFVWKHDKPLPALLAGLDGADLPTTQAFQRILQDNFPIGMPVSEFLPALLKALPGATYEVPKDPNESWVHYTRSELVCRADWDVWWTVDRENRLSGIFGRYSRTCL
jgi:hypothetical protein